MARSTGTDKLFVKRLYYPRIVGMALAFIFVAAVLYQHKEGMLLWASAVFTGFIWPHLAYFIACRDEKPVEAEYRNLMVDAFLGGIWFSYMSFNIVPCLALFLMFSLDNMSVGGPRLALKGVVASIVGAALGVLVSGWSVNFDSTMLTVWATMPSLVIFPLAVAWINHQLSHRLAQQKEELERISVTDGLSQLKNRSHWETAVENEFSRHKRSGAKLSIIMVDIDHFRQINDEFGHAAGDAVIRSIARSFSLALSSADMACRFGGEEFAIILPDTSLEGAFLFAERLRTEVQTLSIKPQGLRCTISLGVAELTNTMEDYEQLIEQADKALYEAKQQGRNISVKAE